MRYKRDHRMEMSLADRVITILPICGSTLPTMHSRLPARQHGPCLCVLLQPLLMLQLMVLLLLVLLGCTTNMNMMACIACMQNTNKLRPHNLEVS